jgi:hypothetical protein
MGPDEWLDQQEQMEHEDDVDYKRGFGDAISGGEFFRPDETAAWQEGYGAGLKTWKGSA